MADIAIDVTEAGTGNYYAFSPDVYDAVVAGIEEVDNPFEEDKTQLEWTFEVPGYTNEDSNVASQRSWCNPVINAKSKMYGWIEAIMGAPPAVGESFRTSTLIGQPCRISLNSGTNQKGEKVIKLVAVMPAKVAAPKKAGLVERLKEEDCSVPNCKKPLSVYDGDGYGFCEKHAPDDE